MPDVSIAANLQAVFVYMFVLLDGISCYEFASLSNQTTTVQADGSEA